jgi:3-oxoacyl-[acyl-carrier-protein] synthase-3
VHLASDGEGYGLINIPSGGSRKPFDSSREASDVLMRIENGKAVFTKASSLMVTASEKALARAGLRASEMAHFVPHQANSRMMSVVEKGTGVNGGTMISTVEHYGNSSAATIPFSLSMAADQRLYKPGDRILMCAAGAGLIGGAIVYGL